MANISTTCPCPHVGIRVGLVYCPLGIVRTSIPCHVGSCGSKRALHVCTTRLRFLAWSILACTGRFFFSPIFFPLFFFFISFRNAYLEKFGFRWTDMSEVFLSPPFRIVVAVEKWKRKKEVDRACSLSMLQIFFSRIFVIF